MMNNLKILKLHESLLIERKMMFSNTKFNGKDTQRNKQLGYQKIDLTVKT